MYTINNLLIINVKIKYNAILKCKHSLINNITTVRLCIKKFIVVIFAL